MRNNWKTFKFVHGFLYCPGGYFLYKQSPNLRISHTKQLVQPFASGNAFYHSFFVSSVKLWNSLPAEVVLCSSIGSLAMGPTVPTLSNMWSVLFLHPKWKEKKK